jgi:hypothetical protein
MGRYDSFEQPWKSNVDIVYLSDENEKGDSGSYSDAFEEFHKAALMATQRRDGRIDGSNMPRSWEDCGRVVLDYFQPTEDDFSKLKEALSRPDQRYSYACEDVLRMRIPHLRHLRTFTRALALKVKAHSALGHSVDGFDNLYQALALIEAGDPGLLISRVVQIGQSKMVLEAILVAQQFHVWNQDEWRRIEAEIGKYDFPGTLPATIRVERITAGASIEPMLEMPLTEMLRRFKNLGSFDEGKPRPVFIRVPVNLLLSGYGRSYVAREWRGCLEAFQETIANYEIALETMGQQPWKDCNTAPLS